MVRNAWNFAHNLLFPRLEPHTPPSTISPFSCHKELCISSVCDSCSKCKFRQRSFTDAQRRPWRPQRPSEGDAFFISGLQGQAPRTRREFNFRMPLLHKTGLRGRPRPPLPSTVPLHEALFGRRQHASGLGRHVMTLSPSPARRGDHLGYQVCCLAWVWPWTEDRLLTSLFTLCHGTWLGAQCSQASVSGLRHLSLILT